MTEHLSYRFDWDEVQHERITAVLGLNALTMDNGAARWDAVALCVGNMAVVITVESDTDQIILTREFAPNGNGWEPISSFAFAITQELGWSWLGINSQGYKDSFTVAFGGLITPQCTFLAEASSLTCFDLAARRT